PGPAFLRFLAFFTAPIDVLVDAGMELVDAFFYVLAIEIDRIFDAEYPAVESLCGRVEDEGRLETLVLNDIAQHVHPSLTGVAPAFDRNSRADSTLPFFMIEP